MRTLADASSSSWPSCQCSGTTPPTDDRLALALKKSIMDVGMRLSRRLRESGSSATAAAAAAAGAAAAGGAVWPAVAELVLAMLRFSSDTLHGFEGLYRAKCA